VENVNKLGQQAEETRALRDNLAGVKNIIMVMSGKGGVGKTTVSVNLALGLAGMGKKTGILDIDIHGPNVPKMLGLQGEQLFASDESRIEPIEATPNLKVVSLALAGYEPERPIIWRGPIKMNVIKQFLKDVSWGELDYLVIDTPPGTGDEPLSICQLLPDMAGTVIVTTPQEVANLDCMKSISFARELKIPILGLIENMSGFVCPECGTMTPIFGKGGGKEIAERFKETFLGELPLDPRIMQGGDEGAGFIGSNGGPAGKAMLDIVGKIIQNIENSSN
jgi:ATP-binding protein involved in chromosome partitioning